MDLVLQTNIFFYITSAAVIAVSILVIVMLYYIVMILRDVKDVSERVREGSEVVEGDLKDLRKTIKKEGLKVRHILDFLLQWGSRKKRKK